MPPASLRPPRNHSMMSPNALSRYHDGSAVELLAWLPILVGHTVTARVVSFLQVEYHPADSKRAQRANL
jgi:hypothetical protein